MDSLRDVEKKRAAGEVAEGKAEEVATESQLPSLPKSLADFFENPSVKGIYSFMRSKDFQMIRKYRNNIAHRNIEDVSHLKSISETLMQLTPEMPAKDASVIKAIDQSMPSIVHMVTMANEFLGLKPNTGNEPF